MEKTTPMLSGKTKLALEKYGVLVCMEAYRLAQQGYGARTIGFYLKLSTNQADAAINAGAEFTHNSVRP